MCADIGIIAIKIPVQILFFEESMDAFSPLQQRSIVFGRFSCQFRKIEGME
jgi:hypothetical protein